MESLAEFASIVEIVVIIILMYWVGALLHAPVKWNVLVTLCVGIGMMIKLFITQI